jgi:hypothetical protein
MYPTFLETLAEEVRFDDGESLNPYSMRFPSKIKGFRKSMCVV